RVLFLLFHSSRVNRGRGAHGDPHLAQGDADGLVGAVGADRRAADRVALAVEGDGSDRDGFALVADLSRHLSLPLTASRERQGEQDEEHRWKKPAREWTVLRSHRFTPNSSHLVWDTDLNTVHPILTKMRRQAISRWQTGVISLRG